MKIGIGTSQFISDYGIQKKIKKIKKIFTYRANYLKKNFHFIDTSPNYKDSLKYLSKKNFGKKIISKIFVTNQNKKKLIHEFEKQKLLIKKNIFYAFLIHNTESIKYASQEIKQLFNYLKNKYQNLKVGFSIYEPKDISLINKYNIQLDIIQSPLNIFDRRLVESKYFLQLKKKNIEIHVRSCFLQGLLLDENIKVRSIYLKNYIKKFHTFCKINKITPLEACIRFIKNYKIDCMILGFDNFLEMKKAIKIFKRKNKKINFPKFICQNHHKVIDPRVWKK